MKHLLKTYITFTRTERAGLLALFLLISILLAIRFVIQYSGDQKEERTLTTAWNNYNNQQQNTTQNNSDHPEAFRKTQQNTTNPSPLGGAGGGFYFDPNTIDSAGLRKLGLREKTTTIFLHWRNKGKHFYRKEELKKLYTLTAAEYARLEPYIVIRDAPQGKIPAGTININKADSATLIGLKGIGPAIAHRILEKRKQLGTFRNIDEVLSVYHFSGDTRTYLEQKLTFK